MIEEVNSSVRYSKFSPENAVSGLYITFFLKKEIDLHQFLLQYCRTPHIAWLSKHLLRNLNSEFAASNTQYIYNIENFFMYL